MDHNIIESKIRKALITTNFDQETVKRKTIDELIEEISTYHIELQYQNEELKRTQQELKQSQMKYKEFFDHAPVGYVIHDYDGQIIQINHRIEKILDRDKTLIYASNIRQWIHPDSQDGLYFFLNRLKKEDKHLSCELKMVFGDNRHVAFYSNPEGGARIRTTMIDITVQKAQQAKITYLSYHDQLTGLYNRHFLEEETKRLSSPRNYPIGLLVMDLNGFKLVNDAFGHKTGDDLLKKMADCLTDNARSDELIARWGGDEFLILFPLTTEQEMKKIIIRLSRNIREALSEPILSSASFGYGMIDGRQGFNEAFADAEKRMYKDKLISSRNKKRESIELIMRKLHEKHPAEQEHVKNVNALCMRFGKALELDDRLMQLLEIASLFHDIGKITVDHKLLRKPGILVAAEYGEIKRHAEAGYRILKNLVDFSDIAEIVLHHHEHFNGSGYPQRLKGEEIPYLDRIIAIADSYEAITNDRPYREAQSHSRAADILVENKGTQFDPLLVDVFVEQVLPKLMKQAPRDS